MQSFELEVYFAVHSDRTIMETAESIQRARSHETIGREMAKSLDEETPHAKCGGRIGGDLEMTPST